MKKFKKGELVLIKNSPVLAFFPLPKLGKIALSEKEKNEHLNKFFVFVEQDLTNLYSVLEVPNKVQVPYLQDMQELLEHNSEEDLSSSMFVYCRKLVFPVPKNALFSVSDSSISESMKKALRKEWQFIKHNGYGTGLLEEYAALISVI